MDAQLKRGILPFGILKLLKKEDMYGYDIVKLIQEYFPDTDESTVYAVLRRLNIEGLTETYITDSPNGPSRKYYRLTGEGVEKLNDYTESWAIISALVEKIGK